LSAEYLDEVKVAVNGKQWLVVSAEASLTNPKASGTIRIVLETSRAVEIKVQLELCGVSQLFENQI